MEVASVWTAITNVTVCSTALMAPMNKIAVSGLLLVIVLHAETNFG